MHAGDIQQCRQAQAGQLQLGRCRERPRRDRQAGLGALPQVRAGARAGGDRVRRDLRVGREPGEGEDPLPRVQDIELAVGDPERHAPRLTHQRIDNRAERRAVRGERIAATAARLDPHLELGLLDVDRYRPDVPRKERQQRDADLQPADPAVHGVGDADGGVVDLGVRLREKADPERLVAHLAARGFRDLPLDCLLHAVRVDEERSGGDCGDEERGDRRNPDDQSAQPAPPRHGRGHQR